jgi:hypothetical protein
MPGWNSQHLTHAGEGLHYEVSWQCFQGSNTEMRARRDHGIERRMSIGGLQSKRVFGGGPMRMDGFTKQVQVGPFTSR